MLRGDAKVLKAVSPCLKVEANENQFGDCGSSEMTEEPSFWGDQDFDEDGVLSSRVRDTNLQRNLQKNLQRNSNLSQSQQLPQNGLRSKTLQHQTPNPSEPSGPSGTL